MTKRSNYNKILYNLLINISIDWKQVSLKTGSKRVADGEIATTMLILNGSRRIGVKLSSLKRLSYVIGTGYEHVSSKKKQCFLKLGGTANTSPYGIFHRAFYFINFGGVIYGQ